MCTAPWLDAPVHVGAQVFQSGVSHESSEFPPAPSLATTWIAARTLAPEDVPAKRASSRARRRAMSLASSVLTGRISSPSAGSQSGGMKPIPTPPILCGSGRPPKQYRQLGGLDGHDADGRLVAAQDGGDAAQGSCHAHRVNEGVNFSSGLAPDLFGERRVARDAVPVAGLVRKVGAGLQAQAAGGVDHVQDQLPGASASLAWDESQLRVELRHVIHLLPAECIGAANPQAIGAGGAKQGQRRPRAAGGVLDDRVAGPQPALLLGARMLTPAAFR